MSDFRPDQDPIEVKASPISAHAMSFVRDALLAVTAWGIGKGYIDQWTGTQIVTIGLGIATVAWRQVVTARTHAKLVTAATAAPNSIAVVK